MLNDTELAAGIIAGVWLSVAIICAGILWVWFPESEGSPEPSPEPAVASQPDDATDEK